MCGIWEKVDRHFQVTKYLPENQVGREYCTSKVTNRGKKNTTVINTLYCHSEGVYKNLETEEAMV